MFCRAACGAVLRRLHPVVVLLALGYGGWSPVCRVACAQNLGGIPGGGLGGGITAAGGAVGGVSIDADGVLTRQLQAADLGREHHLAAANLPADLARPSKLRKISLARLEAQLARLGAGAAPPPEMIHLAGLQRVTHVFVVPEARDIVLAGPAEGWRLDAGGVAIGASNGRACVLLDDLLVALRTVQGNKKRAITCSIDPTTEGLKRLQSYLKQSKQPSAELVAGLERSLGLQSITVGGVRETSHFARIMVAADYRMKRLAMGHDEAPIAGMPSFLSICRTGRAGMQNAMPRWWLADNYDPLEHDAGGLVYRLSGQGVRCASHEDFFSAQAGESGRIERGVRVNPLAERWARTMTEKYEQLAAAEPVFGQLRNCLDLAVISALLVKKDLPGRAGYTPGALLNDAELPTAELSAPRQVASTASLVRRRRDWIVSVSGGVQINPWSVVGNLTTNADLDVTRAELALPADRWWWD